MSDEPVFRRLPSPAGPPGENPPPRAAAPKNFGVISLTDAGEYRLQDATPVEAQVVLTRPAGEIVAAEIVESPPRYGSPLAPAAPQQPRRKWPLIVGLCIGLPLAGIALFALVGWIYVATAKELPITDDDRAVVLRALNVAPHYPREGLEIKPRREKFKKVRYFDGSHEIDYTYETPDGDPNPLQIYCTMTVERRASDAITTHAANQVSGSFDLSSTDGIKLVPRDDLFHWGGDSSLSMVYNQGAPIGHVFFARSEKHVVALAFYGVYFEDKEPLSELLTPVLNRFKKYKP